ncbi:MAG: ribosome maturation factor RimM [Ignavibacteriales bacterium]|nr:ribosome maturation factor RimM [Ignavibacteriales bacterium]
MGEFFLFAEIKSVFSKDGFVSVISYSDFPERFLEVEKVFIEIFGGKKEFFVEEIKHLKNNFAVKFKNFNSDKEVEFLIGKKIFIDSANHVSLKKDTFFVHDLIGCKVYRNGEMFGILKEVLSFPANDVYVIMNELNEEILIPAIKDYVESVDTINKILILKPGGKIYDDED